MDVSILGLTITGGADTPSPGIIITDVREGGAAGNDGFLQVHIERFITLVVLINSPSLLPPAGV